MVRGLEVKFQEGKLKGLFMFTLNDRKLRGDMTALLQYLKSSYKEDDAPR